MGRRADLHATKARALATTHGLGDVILQPLTYAVSALIAIHRGDVDEGRTMMIAAQRLRATSTSAIPSFSIRGRFWMARAHLALSDVDGARTVLREARDFQARRSSLGTLGDELDHAEETVRKLQRLGRSGPTTLSTAELRVLALLPTHLPFREIGERLFISTNTVKSHAMSIYRKLGVSSRSQAVEAARRFGLLDP